MTAQRQTAPEPTAIIDPMSHQGLVWMVAFRYQKFALDLDLYDLVQEGQFGLLRAIEMYEVEHGCQFSTYARYWIEQSIRKAIADKSRAVRLPCWIQTLALKARRGQVCREDLGPKRRECLDAALDVIDRKRKFYRIGVEVGSSTVVDVIDTREPTVDEQAAADRETLDVLLEMLDERSRAVVRMRHGLGGDPMEWGEIGALFGFSRQRAQEIGSKAVRRLRALAGKAVPS